MSGINQFYDLINGFGEGIDSIGTAVFLRWAKTLTLHWLRKLQQLLSRVRRVMRRRSPLAQAIERPLPRLGGVRAI